MRIWKRTTLAILVLAFAIISVYGQNPNADDLYAKGREAEKAENYREAYGFFRQASQLDPDHYRSIYRAGRILKRFGKIDDAIQAYLQALRINPRYAPAYNSLGLLLKKKGDVQGAIESYRRAVAIRPQFASAWRNLGRVLYEDGQSEEAMNAYGHACEVDPGHMKSHQIYGLMLARKGELNEAKRILSIAYVLDPGSEKNLQALVWVKKSLDEDPNDLPDAETNLTDLEKPDVDPYEEWEPDPTNPMRDIERGYVLANKGKFEKAISFFDNALENGVGGDSVYAWLGFSRMKSGDAEGAILEYQHAIRSNPFPPAWYYLNLGHAFSEVGRWKDAIRNYGITLRIDPYYDKAYYNMAVVRMKINDLHGAIQNLRKAIEMNGEFPEAYAALAEAMERQGMIKEAISYYHSAQRLKHDYAETYIELGRILESEGRTEEALENYMTLLNQPVTNEIQVARETALQRVREITGQNETANQNNSGN